jgi:hypothetical protein
LSKTKCDGCKSKIEYAWTGGENHVVKDIILFAHSSNNRIAGLILYNSKEVICYPCMYKEDTVKKRKNR